MAKKLKDSVAIRDYVPEISLDAKQIPAMKKWQVGKTYRIEMTVKQVSMSENDADDYDPGVHGRFKVLKVKECKE